MKYPSFVKFVSNDGEGLIAQLKFGYMSKDYELEIIVDTEEELEEELKQVKNIKEVSLAEAIGYAINYAKWVDDFGVGIDIPAELIVDSVKEALENV